MRLLYKLTDQEFPYTGINHVRDISRGVIYNDNNQIALIHLKGDDIFGHRDYYETPGGGKEKGETFKDALIREIKEEIGVDIDNIEEIGRVIDFYNLINRENNNHYYLAHAKEITDKVKLNEYEKDLFESIVWVDIDKVLEVFNAKDTPISKLVKAREIPILKIAIKMIKKESSYKSNK